jgi:hypothetical protein
MSIHLSKFVGKKLFAYFIPKLCGNPKLKRDKKPGKRSSHFTRGGGEGVGGTNVVQIKGPSPRPPPKKNLLCSIFCGRAFSSPNFKV